MSYLNIPASLDDSQQQNFVTDLLMHKEFYMLRKPSRNTSEDASNSASLQEAERLFMQSLRDNFDNPQVHLTFQSHQLFSSHYLSPHTKYLRALLEYGTGIGKTLSAVRTVTQYIELYKQEFKSESGKSPTIFVLGFTQSNIIRELLKFPDLGFISFRQRRQYLEYQKLAETNPTYRKFLAKLDARYKRNITNKNDGGFFKFIGYQELVNKLFIIEDPNIMINRSNLVQLIAQNKIFINQPLLETFRDSFVICDEIHNVYNTKETNNYGIAIDYILRTLGQNIRALFLSATPINNSPTEIIDLYNILLEDRKLDKRDFFADKYTLLPGKLEELGKLAVGRVLFLQDADIKHYPNQIFRGETIRIPRGYTLGANKTVYEISYLKFRRAVMGEFQYRTYQTLDGMKLGNAERTILDIAFPNPDNPKIGIFNSNTVKLKLQSASQEWKDKNGIYVNTTEHAYTISGPFLDAAKIGKYSCKFALFWQDIEEICSTNDGGNAKFFIFHHWVKLSGVLLIQELFLQNGVLDESMGASENTRCTFCFRTQKHKIHRSDYLPPNNRADIATPHQFMPARFVIVHSEGIDKSTVEASISKFNMPDNSDGRFYKFIIGSKLIKESYDLKAVQYLCVLSLPVNISTLLQVYGRANRRGSHAGLPPEQQRVIISNYITDVEDPEFETSREVEKYAKKIEEYKIIQQIMKVVHENAIDGFVHRESILSVLDKDGEPSLGPLYYEPKFMVEPDLPLEKLQLSTYNAYEYFRWEINEIITFIKRLFLKAAVWTFADLLFAVRNSPYDAGYNKQLLDERNFAIALDILSNQDIYDTDRDAFKDSKYLIHELYNALFDPNIKIIITPTGSMCKIVHVGRYYILAKLLNGRPVVDINIFENMEIPQQRAQIPLHYGINREKVLTTRLAEMEAKYGSAQLIDLAAPKNPALIYTLVDYSWDFHEQIIEAVITQTIAETPFLRKLFAMYRKFRILKGASAYYTQTTLRSYNTDSQSWNETARKLQDWQERTGALIGFLRNQQLKLRSSVNEILKMREQESDYRKIEKGMTCSSYTKERLTELAQQIKIKRPDIKVKYICRQIFSRLVELELAERDKDSNYKYLYLYHEMQPNF